MGTQHSRVDVRFDYLTGLVRNPTRAGHGAYEDDDNERVPARRRLRELGLAEQLDPFEGLRATLNDAA